MGAPSFGANAVRERLNRMAAEGVQAPEVLGTVPLDQPTMTPTPQGPSTAWQTTAGESVALDEGPPPWELEDGSYTLSDGRRYVDVPKEWTIRWINPRLLESEGWRDWRHVSPSDSRVKVKVEQMKAPDGTIRRGGTTGDILAYMPTHWVLARRKQFAEQTARQSQSAVNRQQSLRDEFKRSGIDRFVSIDSMAHPTHTMAEGRSLRDS